MDELAKIPKDHLGAVRLVVIGCAPYDCIPSFQKETKFTEELYCDPDRKVYKALGLGAKMVLISGHSKHVKSSALMGALRSIWRGLKSLRKQGDVSQQGGAFVLGPQNQVPLRCAIVGSPCLSPFILEIFLGCMLYSVV